MPSENLSRHNLIRLNKWVKEKEQRLTKKEQRLTKKEQRPAKKEQRLTKKERQQNRILSHAPESTQPSTAIAHATVIEVHATEALVSYDGRLHRAGLAPSLFYESSTRHPATVGDEVKVSFQDAQHARVEEIVPRRSSLARAAGDASSRKGRLQTHLLAANIDQVIVVASVAEPPFRPRWIDRYLVAASRDELPAILCVNKVDLGLTAESDKYLRGYANLGINVLLTSTATGKGIDALLGVVRGKKSLLTGHSGVGKSSILNAMEPGLARRVGSVTQTTTGQGKGTHTTASSRLVPLTTPDTFIVDTPGIRSLGISGVAPKDLATHFPDIAQLAPFCAFRDCLHDGEQGCALPAAASKSGFLKARWMSYRKLIGELR